METWANAWTLSKRPKKNDQEWSKNLDVLKKHMLGLFDWLIPISFFSTLLIRGQDDQAQKQNDRPSCRSIDQQGPSTRNTTTKWSGQVGKNDFNVFREKTSRIDSRKRANPLPEIHVIQSAQATGLSTLLKRNKWKSSRQNMHGSSSGPEKLIRSGVSINQT